VRVEEFGRGQNTELGWNDPTFCHNCVANVTRGVVPAQCGGGARCLPACRDRSIQFVMQAVMHLE
jgi:hypothetical protein